MCDSNDDDKKSATAKPKPKLTMVVPPKPPLPDDLAFKKPLVPPPSSKKKHSASKQKLPTASSASKRRSPAPTPPPPKRPSPPIGSPSKKSFPPPTPPPSPPPTPPPSPPSPPKQSHSGIPVPFKKRPTASISPMSGSSSSSSRFLAPKRPSSLPTGKRLLPAFNLEQLIVSPPIPEFNRPPGVSQTSSPPTKITITQRATRKPNPNPKGSLLSRMLQASLPPPPRAMERPRPAPPRSPPRIPNLDREAWSLNNCSPFGAIGTGRAASPESSQSGITFEHGYSRNGPQTPPSSPKSKECWESSSIEVARPERPRNPAFGRPASPRAGMKTPPPGKVFTRDGVHYEVVSVMGEAGSDSGTLSPTDMPEAIPNTVRSPNRKPDGLNFFAAIRDGIILPPPFTTSHQCEKCNKNDREKCKNCHQLQPICRICPCCDSYRHFACFEEGCYNPSYWLGWICRYCPSDTIKESRLTYMQERTIMRACSGREDEAQRVYSEYEGSYALTAGKENTPPSTNTKKRPLKLDVPQLLDYQDLTTTSTKKFKKSTTPSRMSTTPKKSPLAAIKTPSTPKTPPTKSPLRTNNSPASSLRPALREISPSQYNRIAASPKASTSTLSPSPKASTSRILFSPKASTSRMSASPKASTSRLSPSPKASTSRMSASPKASTSRMSASPKASTSRLCSSPKASTSRMSASPKASTSRMSASPIASTSLSSSPLDLCSRKSPKASLSEMSPSLKATKSSMVTPEKAQQAEIRAPLTLDFTSPERLVSRYTFDIPDVPSQLNPVKSICERCGKTQPVMRNCFMCQEYVSGRTCGPEECCNEMKFSQKMDLYWYCSVCIKNYHIPQLVLENFCYACLTPMPLAKNCHHCDKFYLYHCDFPYKCIVTHYPSYMMFSRWNHCPECLDAFLGGYVEPLEVAKLTTNLEPWHEEILSVSMNVYNVVRYPSVKRTLNLDEGEPRGDVRKKIHVKWY